MRCGARHPTQPGPPTTTYVATAHFAAKSDVRWLPSMHLVWHRFVCHNALAPGVRTVRCPRTHSGKLLKALAPTMINP
jgi:hypothetical protein